MSEVTQRIPFTISGDMVGYLSRHRLLPQGICVTNPADTIYYLNRGSRVTQQMPPTTSGKMG
ncbi:MAG: hypothetical protein V1871_09820 [Planctomycetota bacterium]